MKGKSLFGPKSLITVHTGKVNRLLRVLKMKEDCKDCKQWQEHFYWNHLDPKKTKFCRIMTGDFSQRMDIPEKFMNHFKEKLAEVVDLKGPSGQVWHIGLTKIANNVFMQYGWKEFVDAHHLEGNDILNFEYKGNSRFRVSMFDASGCEKVSSYFVKNQMGNSEMTENSFERLESDSSSNQVVCISSSTSSLCMQPMANKVRRAGPSGSKRKRQNGQHDHISKRVKREHVPESSQNPAVENLKCKSTGLSRRRPISNAHSKKALQLALAFQPARPSFLIVIKAYHRHILPITREFARRHLPQENVPVILHLPSGKREWKVQYLNRQQVSCFSANWRSFSRDNNLKQGDACVFELSAEETCIAMTVHIFQVAKTSVLPKSRNHQ